MGMEGMGRTFNVVPVADGQDIDLTDAEGVTFVCVGNEAFTLQEHTAGGVAGQNLAVIDRYYQGQDTGVAAWTLETQTAAATVDPDDATNDTVAVFVDANSLSDGFTHVSMTSATGATTAIVQDLAVQRSADNLPAAATAGA